MIVLVSSLGIVAAACGGEGGDDASPLETFFADVKAVIDDADAEADQVEAGMDSGLSVAEDFAALLNVLEEGVRGFQQLASNARDSQEDLEVPEEIGGLHDDFVAIFATAADTLEDIEADFGEIDPTDDEDTLFDQISEVGGDITGAFGSLGDESNAICTELQDIADENDIDVDLECGGPEEE
jgi:hypothetical protein